MSKPTRAEAHELALMLAAGLPGEEAVVYFFELPEDAIAARKDWLASHELAAAIETLQGKKWQAMSSDERIQLAIDKHYNELAYFLYSRNYVTLTGADKAKADTCRVALEVKLAGMAGKGDPLTRFWDDVRSGRVTLGTSHKKLD